MTITVLFFATLKDLAGRDRQTLTLPAPTLTLQQLKSVIADQQPPIAAAINAAVAAVNQEFAFADDLVKDGDEVAFFPPVSGGSTAQTGPETAWPEIYRLADQAYDLNELTEAISTPATGAVCIFSGMVRGETNAEGQLIHTARLEYEAYAPMAIAKMRQVIAEIRERWPLVQGIAVVQRIGQVAVGQPTVLIACASGHRDQGCFEAARYGIDRLKEIVPVWKKDIREQGPQWIEGHYQPKPADQHPQASSDAK